MCNDVDTNKNDSNKPMGERLAVLAIIVEEISAVHQVNELLTLYGRYVVGRMGLPNVREGVNVISIVLSAPAEVINALTGKMGSLKGVTAKTLFSKV